MAFANFEPSCREGNPFPIPLGMTRYKQVANGECCDVWPVGPIIPLTCNRLPLFPTGLEPQIAGPSTQRGDYHHGRPLAAASGRYTFEIPELKFDGVWVRRNNPTAERCDWTFQTRNCRQLRSYGANVLSPAPERCMFGQTIISPPECAPYYNRQTAGPAPIYFNYDC